MTRVLVIAGTNSGVGKTSITLGIARALVNRSVRVVCAKVGPDYLDPTYLRRASGRPCVNLDGWMMGEAYVRHSAARASRNADVLLVEGVMGLFDSAGPNTDEGSTAEIARWLQAPVVLVADAHGQARSLAATVSGFSHFDPGIRLAGVIANRVGSDRHAEHLRATLTSNGQPPLVGAIPRGSLPSLPSRHLGLVHADASHVSNEYLDELASKVSLHVDLDTLLANAQPLRTVENCDFLPAPAPRPLRLGVAQDAAFHFVYPDLRDTLAECACEMVPCSPLTDRALPENLDGFYIPGGYPEEHAHQLSANVEFKNALRTFAEHRPLLAECGGLMYIAQAIRDRAGCLHSMVGLLPTTATMRQHRKVLGYAEVTLRRDTLWGTTGSSCRGHEFHYSHLDTDPTADGTWSTAYQITYRSAPSTTEGFVRSKTLASYVHLHLPSRPKTIEHLLARLAT